MTRELDVETELEALARARTWRVAIGAALILLATLVAGVTWFLGSVQSLHIIANTANPTPEQLADGLLVTAKWAVGLGGGILLAGVVTLGFGLACHLRLQRFRREWAELA